MNAPLGSLMGAARAAPDRHWLPHRDGTDGFFGAVLRKAGS